MANQIKAPINYPVIAGGKIVAGGSVLFGQPNVKPDEDNPSTLKAVYLDAALTQPAQNPQGLSSDGVFDQSDNGVLFGSSDTVYSIVIKGANNKELSYIPEYDLSDANAAAAAQDSAADAASSEANALSFKNLTEALYTDFTNRYFGAFSSDPSVDDLGNPPNEGSIYFNSTSNVFFTWTDGAWVNHFPSNPNGLLVTATGTTTPRALGDWTEKEILSYDTIADAKADLKLEVGRRVKTYGYYSIGDSGGAEYVVVAGGTGTDDDGSFHDAVNGNQLKLVIGSFFLAEHFGTNTLDSTTQLQKAINFSETSAIPMRSITELNLTGVVQIGQAAEVTNLDIQLYDTKCSAGAGYKIGSNSSYVKRSKFTFGSVTGTGRIANNVDLIHIEAMAQSNIEISNLSDSRNGILITPAIASGDNRWWVGRIGGCVNGIHFDNTVNFGGGHGQNNQFEVGLILTCNYGLRKTIDLTGSPMDLTYFRGALDFNITNDILDNQPDSKSTYELMFSDDGNAYVSESLVGVGIETSFIIKHYRGVGSKGMFIGMGNETAGILNYGRMRASNVNNITEPQFEINNQSKLAGKTSRSEYTHSNPDQTGKIRAARIESTYIDEDNSNLVFAVLGDGNIQSFLALNGATKNLNPVTDNSFDVGSSTKRLKQLYAVDLKAGDGSTKWTTGAGSPEGNLIANIGSIYTRTDGSTGNTLYIKESGTGSTGWVAK